MFTRTEILVFLFILSLLSSLILLAVTDLSSCGLPSPSGVLDIGGLDSGDLVFFAGATQGENFCKFISDCPFSHVGLILVENGKRYIWDADIGQGKREGPRVQLLEEKMRRYKGHKIIGVRKLIGGELPLEKVKSIVNRYTAYEFNNTMFSWLLSNFPILSKMISGKRVFCSELIALTLQELGVMSKTKIPAWFTPGNLLRMTRREFFAQGFKYTQPFFFLFI